MGVEGDMGSKKCLYNVAASALVVVAIGACAGSTPNVRHTFLPVPETAIVVTPDPWTPTPVPTPTPTPTAYFTPYVSPTPELTALPSFNAFAVGQPVVIVGADPLPVVEVTVSGVRAIKTYSMMDQVQKPAHAGDVYLMVTVAYAALEDGVKYGDIQEWVALCGSDCQGGHTSRVLFFDGAPALMSGTLAKGERATGAMLFEVPPKGSIHLVYVSGVDFLHREGRFQVIVRG
jgi:hypothetical protein